MAEELFELAMTAPGVWSASGKERFQQPNGSQFGGYVSGLMVSATLGEPTKRGMPIAMTGAFMSRVQVGPLQIHTTRLRSGSTLEFWQAAIFQNDALCAQATITLAQRPESSPDFGWIAMPEAPPPETLARDVYEPPAPPTLNTFDNRSVRAGPGLRPKDGVSVCWTKDDNGAPMDYPRLAMFADKFGPRAMFATGRHVASSTVSFSTYFHASESEVAGIGTEYILQEGRGRRGSHGTCDLTAAMWRRDGLLLATTEQLCWFR